VTDGLEATRRIRRLAPACVVIGLTGNALEDDTAEMLAVGCAKVLTKPTTRAKLVESVAFLLDDDFRPQAPPPRPPLTIATRASATTTRWWRPAATARRRRRCSAPSAPRPTTALGWRRSSSAAPADESRGVAERGREARRGRYLTCRSRRRE
jgi:CheY-like chemotaxis protein